MLSKIFNISPNSDFRNSKKSSKASKQFKAYRPSDYDIHDKADFSPPLLFITNINWQLKNFHEDSIGITISFSAAGIDFLIKCPINNFDHHTKLDYQISKVNKNKENRCTINLLVDFSEIKDINIEPLEFESLNILFTRLFEFDNGITVKRTEKSLIDSLMEQIQENLYTELNYVNNYLILFLSKINDTLIKNIAASKDEAGILFKEAAVTSQ